MRVYHYGQDWPDGKCNLGDWLTVPLMRALGHQPEPPEPGQPVLFGIGSILGREHYQAKAFSRIVVWGSGLMFRSDDLRDPRVDFLAVRGPITRDTLGLPATTPLGDPALLLPKLIKLPSLPASGEFLYINHCGEGLQKPPGFDGYACAGTTESEALSLVARIAAARFVASESLHGCILAAAYDVPWAPCSARFPQPPQISDKWSDWMAYLGLGPISAMNAAHPSAAESWWLRIGRHGRVPDTQPLLESFPCSL